MYIRGETAQHLSTFLTKAESQYNQKQFFSFLEEQQELDPKTFSCTQCAFGDQPLMLIFGEHAKKRIRNRLCALNGELEKMVQHQLSNQQILQEILTNQVCYDEDNQRACGFSGTTVNCTIVFQEGSDIAIIYEAGFIYVRVKTVWDTKQGGFFLQNTAAPVLLRSDESISVDPGQIHFVL